MSESPMNVAPATVAKISRRATVRAVVLLVMLVAGVATLHAIEIACGFSFVKTPMPLKQPLSMIPRQLGTPARYVVNGFDEYMDEAILEVLGTRDYLLRWYRDVKKPTEPTEMMRLNMNYYAVGTATPHVPEICWAGAGMRESSYSRRLFEVTGVPRKDGSQVTLRCHMISFVPNGEVEDSKRLKNVVYFFNVNGEYVATPREVVSKFWRARSKYAYDTKIELTIGRPDEFCSQDEAIAAFTDFIRASLADMESCLPDVQDEEHETQGGFSDAAISK